VKAFRLPAICLLVAPAEAGAQQPPPVVPQIPISGQQVSPPPSAQRMHGPRDFHGFPIFLPGFVWLEREYVPVIEREVVREIPAEQPAPPTPPPPPRKPYVIGRSYSSLPGTCMKMVEKGAAYFLCNGEWYRQVGSRQYKAVARP
jgi:hypothetical protein